MEKPQAEVKTYTGEDFVKEYNQLVEKMGWRIVAKPVFVGRDDGTFSVVLNYAEGATPKEN